MPKHKLMHEATTPSIEVAHKYSVATFDEYKQQGHGVTSDYDPVQCLAFALVYYLHCFSRKPQYFVLSHKFVLKLYNHLDGKMISEFEGVRITHDESQSFRITSLG